MERLILTTMGAGMKQQQEKIDAQGEQIKQLMEDNKILRERMFKLEGQLGLILTGSNPAFVRRGPQKEQIFDKKSFVRDPQIEQTFDTQIKAENQALGGFAVGENVKNKHKGWEGRVIGSTNAQLIVDLGGQQVTVYPSVLMKSPTPPASAPNPRPVKTPTPPASAPPAFSLQFAELWRKTSGSTKDRYREFFRQLPLEMTPEELAVKWELVKICARHSRIQMGKLVSNQHFDAYFRQAYPEKAITLDSWVEHRAFEDFDKGLVCVDEEESPALGQRKRKFNEESNERNGMGFQKRHTKMVWLKEESPSWLERTAVEWQELLDEEEKEWFLEQPTDGFTTEEEELRISILQYLSGCSDKKAQIEYVMDDVRVQVTSRFLPLWIPIPNWIEWRIGEEVEYHEEEGEKAFLALTENVC